MNNSLSWLILTVSLSFMCSVVEAEDYFPEVTGVSSDECYREITACRQARLFHTTADERVAELTTEIERVQTSLTRIQEQSLPTLEEQISSLSTMMQELSALSTKRGQRIVRKIERLAERVQDQNRSGSERTLKKMRRAENRFRKISDRLRDEFYQRNVMPLESAKEQKQREYAQLVSKRQQLEAERNTTQSQKAEALRFTNAFCRGYLASCIPAIGLQCVHGTAPSQDRPWSVLYPEYYDEDSEQHKASVMFRTKKSCATGEALEEEEIIVLDGTQCNYVCRSRFPEECLSDGSYDTYYDETCYSEEGTLISIPQPDSGR